MAWQDTLTKLMADNGSGASYAAGETASMPTASVEEREFASVDEMSRVISEVAQKLLMAQAAMGPLVSLLNRVFFAVSGSRDVVEAGRGLQAAAASFVAEQQHAHRELANRAASLIPAGVTVITHSFSSTVAETIKRAAQMGRAPRVICLESRPANEGRRLASSLHSAGIEVIYTLDCAAYDNLLRADLVLISADSLTEDGVIAKIGTAGLAVSAQAVGVPCYTLADSSKIWPTELGMPPEKERDPAEIWAEAPSELRVRNRYFDHTPWQAVAGIVTEQGMLTPEELRISSREKRVHRALQAVMAEVRSSFIKYRD